MGENPWQWIKHMINNDLVDLLHLAHPATMITEEMLTLYNLLNEFDFHVNKE